MREYADEKRCILEEERRVSQQEVCYGKKTKLENI